MALYLVLLSTILAFSLTSTEQYVLSPGSSINLFLDSMKNASGHWITKVDTRQYSKKENTQPLSVNVHQEANIETEHRVSGASASPSLDDTSMSGAVQPTAASSTTTTTNNSFSTTTTTITITTTPDMTITTTTTPKSCPHSGYQLYPEFNCYKAFPSTSEERTWSEARDQCVRDGGDLMVMETEGERQDVYLPLYNSESWSSPPWVGVYKPDGWMTVNGEPVPSTWWWPGDPDNDARRKCAFALSSGLLMNYNCAITQTFICEISL